MIELQDLEKFPTLTARGLFNYMNYGARVGGFLTALLSNDLQKAVLKADDENIKLLREYVQWLTFNAPGEAWGSPEKVNAWIKKKEQEQHEQA